MTPFTPTAARAILRGTMHLLRAALFALVFPLALACDSGEAKKEEPAGGAAAPAKAEEAKKPEDDPIARRRAEREAKAAAEKAAEEERKAKIEALAVLPAKLPKDLKKACEGVADAQLKFFEKMYEGAKLEKLKAAQGTQRPMTLQSCQGQGSIEIAACQINALTTAEDKILQDAVSDIARVCAEKFAKK